MSTSDSASLVTKFAALSAVAFVVLGVVLARNIRSGVTQEHLSSATNSADLVASLGIKPLFSSSDFLTGLTRQESDKIDEQLSADKLQDRVVRIKVWSNDGTVIYSDEDALVGRSFDVGGDLAGPWRVTSAPRSAT